MHSIKNLFILGCSVILYFISCAPVYVPNNLNTPQFSQSGETNIGGWYGSNDIGLSASTAASDNLALMVNGSFGSQKGSPENGKDAYEFSLWEGGLGIYDTFGQASYYDFFAGYGMGFSSYVDYHDIHVSGGWGNDTYLIERKAKGDFNRIFIQGSISSNFSSKFSFGLASRFSNVSFSKLFLDDDAPIKANEPFCDSAFFIVMKEKNIKIKTQIGASIPLRDKPVFAHKPLWVSFGIDLYFNKSKNIENNYKTITLESSKLAKDNNNLICIIWNLKKIYLPKSELIDITKNENLLTIKMKKEVYNKYFY